VNYHSDEAGALHTKKIIEEHGAKAVLFKADASKENEVRDMFRCMFDSFGPTRYLRAEFGDSAELQAGRE